MPALRSRPPGAQARVEYGCWPQEAQRLLLKACLLERPKALAAWERWQSLVDLDAIDPGSVRLLPLLYSRLTGMGVDSPLLARLRGVQRQTWYRNQLLIGKVASLLERLHARGIPTIALKGLALVPHAYGHVALRPMADADLLVPAAQAASAAETLVDAGWTRAHPAHEWPPRFTASRAFAHALGLELDLHVHAMHECLEADADDDFWTAAVPLDVGGAPTQALCPADQLLHVITHGFRRSTVPPIRWLADAVVVVRAAGAGLDWSRFVAQARRRRVALMALDGLRFMTAELDVDVPAAVPDRLRRGGVGLEERVEHWARSEPGRLRLAGELWCEYRRARGREPQWRGPLGLPRYVRDRLALGSVAQVPGVVWSRLR